MTENIIITNEKIISFFKENETIHPETAFLLLIDFFEKIGKNNHLFSSSSSSTSILSSPSPPPPPILDVSFLEILKKEIQTQITTIIKEETKTINNDNFKECLHSLETRFSNTLVQNINLPIHNYIQSSEEKMSNKINSILDLNKENTFIQNKLYGEMNDFLNKYKVSSNKGNYTEVQLQILLNQMFDNGQITNTSGVTSSGDFLLKRNGKPDIMFENKDYKVNVCVEEIRKFIRDANNIKSHSIFLSQHSGISTKNNYQIEVHKDIILVYLHNVEYSKEKIQIAVDIIDSLSPKLAEFNNQSGGENTINKFVLDEIYKEYQDFANHKDELIGIIKESNKKTMEKIEEMKFTSLEKYLSDKYASTINTKIKLVNQLKCELCNFYVCNSKKSLSAHQRGCKKFVGNV
jgi:hypothetical protein